MKKLKIKYVRQYRSRNGNLTFVHEVQGSPEAIQQYVESQGDNLRRMDDKPDGAPLFFTTRATASNANEILQTRAGSWIIDSSETDRMAAFVAQNGGNLGQALAEQFAKKINFGTTTAPQAEQVPAGGGGGGLGTA
jgi:hypothetical protein